MKADKQNNNNVASTDLNPNLKYSYLQGPHTQQVITPSEIYTFIESDECKDIIEYNTKPVHSLSSNQQIGKEDNFCILDFCPTDYETKFDCLATPWDELLQNVDLGDKTPLVYMNPPYDNVDAFIVRANQELERLRNYHVRIIVIFLIPARIATIGFDQFIWRKEPQDKSLGWMHNACFFIGSILGHLKFMGNKRPLYCDMCMVFMSNRNKSRAYDETIRYNRMEPCYTSIERRNYGIKPRTSRTEKLKRKLSQIIHV